MPKVVSDTQVYDANNLPTFCVLWGTYSTINHSMPNTYGNSQIIISILNNIDGLQIGWVYGETSSVEYRRHKFNNTWTNWEEKR